jgi:hypothetical protein
VLLCIPIKIAYGGRGDTNDVCGPKLAHFSCCPFHPPLPNHLCIISCCRTDGNWNAIFTFVRSSFLLPTFFSLLFLTVWLLFCFPRRVYHLYQQIFCCCRFLLFQANFGFCRLGLIALDKRSRQAVRASA